MDAPPSVSVVVLSYNRPQMLRESLASVATQTLAPTEVIVVDNPSPASAEVARVSAGFSRYRLIANNRNLGFTGGMNAGLKAAGGDFVVLSEDDIVLSPDALKEVINHLVRNPNVGLVGGLMLNRSTGTVHCAGGRVRLGSRFEMAVIGQGDDDSRRLSEPFGVNYLPGAFIAARRQVWERFGGFRSRYFMYMEDIDLCLRVASAGLRIEVVPAARLWHFDPPPPRLVPGWLRRLKSLNLLRLYLLNAPVRVLPMFLARYYAWDAARSVLNGNGDGWHAFDAVFRALAELPDLMRERNRARLEASSG